MMQLFLRWFSARTEGTFFPIHLRGHPRSLRTINNWSEGWFFGTRQKHVQYIIWDGMIQEFLPLSTWFSILKIIGKPISPTKLVHIRDHIPPQGCLGPDTWESTPSSLQTWNLCYTAGQLKIHITSSSGLNHPRNPSIHDKSLVIVAVIIPVYIYIYNNINTCSTYRMYNNHLHIIYIIYYNPIAL